MRYFLIVAMLVGMAGSGWAGECNPPGNRESGVIITDNADRCYGKHGERVGGMCIVNIPGVGGMCIVNIPGAGGIAIYNDGCGTVENMKIPELIKSAEGVLPYLDGPSDRAESIVMTHPIYRPLPTELEAAQERVENLKKKDSAIKRFREALEKAKN